MRVNDPLAAAAKLHSLVLEQQWDPVWSIKRVDTVDHVASIGLPKFPAPQDCHNLHVAVKAANDMALENAFHTIEDAVKPWGVPAPHGHVVSSSTYLDWS